MKLMKEVANPRCLSYSIRNPAVLSLNTRTRQRVLAFGGPRQEVVTKKNTVSKSRPARSRTTCPVSIRLGSRRAWKGDLGTGKEVIIWKLYLGLAFTIPTLERVTIRCCEVDGGGGGGGEVFGGGVFGGGVVFSGDDVGNRVRGVVCGVACGIVCGVVCGGVC
nr:hypothetical protein [Tanacetum cinerariifolium]